MSGLASEQVILAAPMSFVGSTRRLWRWLAPRARAHAWYWGVPIWAILGTLLLLAWVAIFVWYCLFGAMLVPYRLVRRWQRHGKRDALRHREILTAVAR